MGSGCSTDCMISSADSYDDDDDDGENNKQHVLEVICFEGKGASADLSRLVLAVGKIPFHDGRLSHPDFSTLLAAGHLPFDSVPILKLQKRTVSSHIMAELRSAAEHGKLQVHSQDSMQAGEVLAAVAAMRGLWEEWFNAFSEASKQRSARNIADHSFLQHAEYIEALLSCPSRMAHTGPFVSESISFVDLYLFSVVDALRWIASTIHETLRMETVPNLAILLDAVAAWQL